MHSKAPSKSAKSQSPLATDTQHTSSSKQTNLQLVQNEIRTAWDNAFTEKDRNCVKKLFGLFDVAAQKAPARKSIVLNDLHWYPSFVNSACSKVELFWDYKDDERTGDDEHLYMTAKGLQLEKSNTLGCKDEIPCARLRVGSVKMLKDTLASSRCQALLGEDVSTNTTIPAITQALDQTRKFRGSYDLCAEEKAFGIIPCCVLECPNGHRMDFMYSDDHMMSLRTQ